MYQTNPRFQSEAIRHVNPQLLNPSPEQQQPTPTPETSQGRPSQPGLSAQQTPPVGDLAAQLADLQARQSSLEAQQAQSTQAQPMTPSPTAQRFSPTMQPSTGVQPSPQAPFQPQQQPQGAQQPRQLPQQLPQQFQPPQLQQPPQRQQGPTPSSRPEYGQLRGLPGRLRSMVGIPLFSQGQQGPSRSPGGPGQHPGMQQQQRQLSPQMQQQGSQVSPMQTQMGQGGQVGGQPGQPGQRRVRQPPVDILDEGDDLVLEIELPGARKEDIQLTGQRNAVQLYAPTRERREKENLLQSERGQILYQRSIPLGIEIDSEQIEAKFEDGVLRVTAPKRDPKSGPQRIEIN